MNASEAEFNVTSSLSPTEPTTLLSTLSILSSTTTTALSPFSTTPPLPPPDAYDPQLTIMVVLGLSLLLAGLAAFLAVCRPSGDEEDNAESGGGACGRGGESHGGALSSEPQLKVWKRLGSYRRTYNMASFRRPQHRRPHCEREHVTHASQSPPARQTLQPEAGAEPHVTTPCLFDYVTEI